MSAATYTIPLNPESVMGNRKSLEEIKALARHCNKMCKKPKENFSIVHEKNGPGKNEKERRRASIIFFDHAVGSMFKLSVPQIHLG